MRGPRVAIVHNGTDPVVPTGTRKSARPTVCVVGRLVPHKQVEHAVDAVLALREQLPDLRLHIVGSGWWEAELRRYVTERGAGDAVVFEGHVSEVRKQEVYEESWVMALPSVKEGWGLVVGEAAAHGTPTVAYSGAGGTRESIRHGISGLLVETPEELTRELGRVLRDLELRRDLAEGARVHSVRFSWGHAQSAFAHVVASALRGELVDSQDAVEE